MSQKKEGAKRSKANKENKANSTHSEMTDEEKEIVANLADETREERRELDIIKNITPEQFERLCVILFTKAGYEDAKNTQRSRDGGYDGEAFYLQGLTRMKVVFESKRYNTGPVGIDPIRKLLHVSRKLNAEKAVFITTSSFTKDARNEADEYGMGLIDGERLVELLKKYSIGFEKQIDKKYFDGI